MSELTYNLSQIYNCKLAIKAAIGTQSDELADYAGYITALKPDGYTYINENGDYDVAGYEYAYIDVPVPAGYVYVSGTKSITENGDSIDISSYAYIDVNVPTGGGGSSRDIDDKPTSNYGSYGLHPAIHLNDKYYDSLSGSYDCLISSKCFTQDYPSYIDAEYIPTSITGQPYNNAYYISYETDITSRNLSYNSLRDISERASGEAGFFKAKVNFKTTSDTIPSADAMFTTTKNQVLNSNTNVTYYDIESLGSVQRYDAKWADDLNKTFLRINSYYSNGVLTSYYPMTYMSKNLQEKNNTYYDMGNLLHNSYNVILWVDKTEASGMKNSMVVDIVGWNGEAQLPAAISSMNFNFVSGGAAPIAWTDNGNAYTYTMAMTARQSMQISTTRTNSSYFTCTLGSDATSYYVKVPNMQIIGDDASSYWVDFTTTGSSVSGQLVNTNNESINVELSIDKSNGKLTVGKVQPKNGWYIYTENDGNEYPMDGASGSSDAYKYMLGEYAGSFRIYHYVNDEPTQYYPQISGDESDFVLDEYHVGITTDYTVNWMLAGGYNTIYIGTALNEAWAANE